MHNSFLPKKEAINLKFLKIYSKMIYSRLNKSSTLQPNIYANCKPNSKDG